jgi:hypothetical protein
MMIWNVTVIDRKDKTKTPQEMRVEDAKLTTVAKVRAFAKSKWRHLRFVKAEQVEPAEQPPQAN